MAIATYKRLMWGLIGAVVGMIMFVPSLWLGDVILGGLIGFAIAYAICAFVLRRRAAADEPVDDAGLTGEGH